LRVCMCASVWGGFDVRGDIRFNVDVSLVGQQRVDIRKTVGISGKHQRRPARSENKQSAALRRCCAQDAMPEDCKRIGDRLRQPTRRQRCVRCAVGRVVHRHLQRQLASALFSSSSSTIAPFFGRLRDTPEENSIGGTAQHCFGAYLTRQCWQSAVRRDTRSHGNTRGSTALSPSRTDALLPLA
jgi:hypothetical protein